MIGDKVYIHTYIIVNIMCHIYNDLLLPCFGPLPASTFSRKNGRLLPADRSLEGPPSKLPFVAMGPRQPEGASKCPMFRHFFTL